MIRVDKSTLITVFFGFCFFFSFSQDSKSQISNPKISSLQELYSEDIERYRTEYLALEDQFLGEGDKLALSELYLFHYENISSRGDYDSLLTLLHTIRGLNSASKKSDPLSVLLNLVSVFNSKGKLDSMVYYHDKSTELIKKDSPYYGHYLVNEALIRSSNSEHKQAIQLILEAIELFETANDLNKMAIAYNNLAFNFERLGDFDSHVQYLMKAVALNKKLGNTYRLIMNYNNIGSTYRERNLLEEAIAFYDSAFIQLEKLYNPLQMAQNLLNRANIYKRKGDLEVAEPLYLKALSLCEEHQISYGEMLAKINLGDLYRQRGQFARSRESLKSALELSLTLNARREEALIYEKQAWLARDLGEYKDAYQLIDRFHVLNDSLVNESVRKEANALREKYEVEKKESEILSLSKQKLYQQLVIAGMAIGLLVTVILVQWWRNKHKLLSKEKEKVTLQRKHLREVLENKDKELTAQAAQLIQMQQLLESTKSNMADILGDSSLEQTKVKKIKAALNKNAVLEVKKDFDIRITESNKDFFNTLLKIYPDLKPAELKLCAYLRLNLSSKEISEITNRSIRTIETIRSSIRKKMGLGLSDSLVSHLISLELVEELP